MTCKECEKRHIGCHSTCREYNLWRAKKDHTNEIVQRKKRVDIEFVEEKVKQCEKMRRKKNRYV